MKKLIFLFATMLLLFSCTRIYFVTITPEHEEESFMIPQYIPDPYIPVFPEYKTLPYWGDGDTLEWGEGFELEPDTSLTPYFIDSLYFRDDAYLMIDSTMSIKVDTLHSIRDTIINY